MCANLASGQEGAKTETQEDKHEEAEVSELSNLLLQEKEICTFMQEVHAGNQKCQGGHIQLSLCIAVAGLYVIKIFGAKHTR
jgi:hypothetical protein